MTLYVRAIIPFIAILDRILLLSYSSLKIIIIKVSERMGSFAIPDYWIHPLGCGKNTNLLLPRQKRRTPNRVTIRLTICLFVIFTRKMRHRCSILFRPFLWVYVKLQINDCFPLMHQFEQLPIFRWFSRLGSTWLL